MDAETSPTSNSRHDNEQSNFGAFNVLFMKRFIYMLKLMFPSACSGTVLLFVFLLCISLLEQFVINKIGFIPSQFYQVLNDKDTDAFFKILLMACVYIVSIAFIRSTSMYASSILYIRWREYITKFLHRVYFYDIAFYNANVLDKNIDNPDQRITQDVDKMCNILSQIIAVVLISPFTIGYYIYQAWVNTGYIGPVSVFVFFIICTFINQLIMSSVIKFFVKQEKKEGNFRYKHMQIRTHAEAIAFYRAGKLECLKSDKILHDLITTQNKLMNRKYFLNFSIQFADYVGSILSYVALAIPIFAGRYDDLTPGELSALISKNAFVCIYLINCFTKLIDLSVNISDIAGATHRICQLIESLNEYKSKHENNNNSETNSDISDHHDNNRPNGVTKETVVNETESTERLLSPISSGSSISIEEVKLGYRVKNLTYYLPFTDEVMLRSLDLMILSGVNILITGDSGCGKSSLLRVVCNLWTNYYGEVERFVTTGPRGMFYLPQRPYFTNGTLREQIIFPTKYSRLMTNNDAEIVRYLELAGLMSVFDRVGGLDMVADVNWFNVLSPGEMQRLSFVRLFYHRPPFAALDEASSQIGTDAERTLYRTCRELGITVISVGHRDSLKQFHDCRLHLDGKAGWTFENIQ